MRVIIFKFGFLFLLINGLAACSTINVDIQSPADNANVSSGAFNLQSKIKSSGQCMGGERCDHVNWVLEINGVDTCSGQGSGGAGTYAWCASIISGDCIFNWNNINTADIGNGSHQLVIKANASCHKDASDSITITIP